MNTIDETKNPAHLMTVHEFARKLRVDDTTVRRWIKEGVLAGAVILPARGKRKSYRIPNHVLYSMLKSQ